MRERPQHGVGKCLACDAPAGSSNFCDGHVGGWVDAPERQAILRCLDALGPLAHESSRPHLGRALDAIIAAAQSVFADRVRSGVAG